MSQSEDPAPKAVIEAARNFTTALRFCSDHWQAALTAQQKAMQQRAEAGRTRTPREREFCQITYDAQRAGLLDNPIQQSLFDEDRRNEHWQQAGQYAAILKMAGMVLGRSTVAIEGLKLHRELPPVCTIEGGKVHDFAAAMDEAKAIELVAKATPTAAAKENGQRPTVNAIADAVVAKLTQSKPASDGKAEQDAEQSAISPKQKRKAPCKNAITAYRLWFAMKSSKQTELANTLAMEISRPVTQGQFSRWLQEVKSWLEAGNVLPNMDTAPAKKPISIDPAIIEMGERQDGRDSRQRQRRNTDNPAD